LLSALAPLAAEASLVFALKLEEAGVRIETLGEYAARTGQECPKPSPAQLLQPSILEPLSPNELYGGPAETRAKIADMAAKVAESAIAEARRHPGADLLILPLKVPHSVDTYALGKTLPLRLLWQYEIHQDQFLLRLDVLLALIEKENGPDAVLPNSNDFGHSEAKIK
jgi:hypothetical protein